MRYHHPGLQPLLALGTQLRKKYSHTNAQRFAFIQLYEEMVKLTQNSSLLIGAIIFELEVIQKEYKGANPRRTTGYLYSSGSELFSLLETELGITKENPLDDTERLIHLCRFYEFMQESPLAQTFYAAKKKETMIQQIEEALRSIVHRQENRIEFLAYGEQKPEVLKEKIATIIPQYQKATTSRFFSNKKREKLMDLIYFVNESCGLEDRKKAYQILMGALLFAVIKIQPEYKLTSANQSALYTICLETMNVKNLEAIQLGDQVLWLKSLSQHLDEKLAPIHNRRRESICWQMEVDTTVADIEKKKIASMVPNSYVAHAAGSVAKNVAEKSLNNLATQGLTFFAVPALGGAFASGLIGPIGLVVYGTVGTIVMAQLGRFLRDNVIPKGVGFLYLQLLEQLGKAMHGHSTQEMAYTFSVSQEGFKALMGSAALTEEDKQFLGDWIETLMKLPDSILPSAEKQHIQRVLGIENEMDIQSLLSDLPEKSFTAHYN